MNRQRRVCVLVAALGSGLLAGCGAPGGEDEAPAIDAMVDAIASGLDAMPDAMPDTDVHDSDAILSDLDAIPDAVPGATLDATPDSVGDDPDAIADATADAMWDAEPDAARRPVDAGPPDAAPPDALLDPNREHRCEDGLDGDGDGVADCADGDCLDADACRGVPMTPVERVQDLFIQRCGCHTGALDEGGLTLIRPFTDTTIGQPAVLDPERILIVPGDAQASFLYLKLLDGLPAELGERMPPEIPYFDPDQLRLVADWITGLTPR